MGVLKFVRAVLSARAVGMTSLMYSLQETPVLPDLGFAMVLASKPGSWQSKASGMMTGCARHVVHVGKLFYDERRLPFDFLCCMCGCQHCRHFSTPRLGGTSACGSVVPSDDSLLHITGTNTRADLFTGPRRTLSRERSAQTF